MARNDPLSRKDTASSKDAANPRNPVSGPGARAAGRSEELATLRGAYREACGGGLRLLLVGGPSETGKGALLDAWLGEHRAGPVLRVDGRGEAPVEQIIELALAHLSPVRRARHPVRLLLDPPRPRARVVDLLALAERRLRLREEVDRLLGEIGTPNPAIVLIDGFGRADRSTIDLVAGLVKGGSPFAARPNVLFVATIDGAPTGRLAELARSDAARSLTLRPLDHAGVRAFLATPDAVDAVLALTGGLPDLIERLLSGEGLPRQEEVEPRARGAIELLAIADRPTSATLLESLVGTLDAEALVRAGARCSSEPGSSGPGSSGPDNSERGSSERGSSEPGSSGPDNSERGSSGPDNSEPLVRDRGAFGPRLGETWVLAPHAGDRVRASLDTSATRALHARLADALAAERPEIAARHALAASMTERAVELALDGVDALVARHAPVDAADLLLEVTRAHEAPPIAIRRRLVELLWIAGDHADAVEHARALAEGSPEDALLLGRLLALAGRRDEALRTLERALAGVDESSRQLAEAALADARYQAGDLDGAEALATRVAGADDARLTLDALNTRAKIAIARGDLTLAEEILHRTLRDAEAASIAQPACQALNNLAIVAMSRGELSQATQWLERMLVLADRSGAVYYRGIAHKNLAVVHQLEGEWGGALQHAERALSLLSGLGNVSLMARLSFNTADLHRSLGDPYRALRLCAHARGVAGGTLDGSVDGEGLRVEAAIHTELGHTKEADESWTAALALADEQGHRAAAAECRLGLAQLAVDAGDTERARSLVAPLDERSLSARDLARLAHARARLGEGEERIPLARFAVDAAAKTSDPLLLQVAHLELARALAGAGLAGRAREELALIRERERELTGRVPAPLRTLFAERSLVRRLAGVERSLSGHQKERQPRPESRRPMIGESFAMHELRSWIERVGPTDSTVLITGESGTGKELVAEALHDSSRRAERPFVRVNCAALVDTLLSSELFGHERGAFTGADRQKKGRFELAEGGTILLDEIGDVSPRMQASLLRVLQERTFERVGGTRTHRIDVRVIAATHRDLATLVAEGSFREDLYYRLGGITVRVPSLRERIEDLPALCRHLLAKIAEEDGGDPKLMAPDALERLARHDWRGNVRELENALRSTAVLAPSDLLTAADFEVLAPQIGARSADPPPSDASLGALTYERVRDGDGSIYELRKRVERECIERALDDSAGNISKAAELLGMKRPRLSKLVNEWGLKR